jgi:ankyrin repeat protein
MTLEETYERTLREINVAQRELAQSLFRCVAVASRPLRVKELTDLLAFDFKAGPSPKFREDWREEDPVYAVQSTCSCFLAVVEVEDVQVIQFSHFSVKEFLTSDRLSKANDTITNYHISMTPAHTLIARACLGILLHLPKDVTRDSLQKFSLVEYAAEHWVDHARFKGVSPHVEHGIKHLFDPSKPHLEVWVWIHDPEMLSQAQTKRAETPPPLRGTPLHYAAICGLHAVAESLVTEHLQDVHSQGFNDKSTPMHAAASRGHAEVIRVLLKHGAVATAKTRTGWTPLHRAADGGHAEVAQVLLEHDRAIAAAKAKNGRTPLHVASDRGLVEVARVLLKYGADATAKDRNERTPLHAASLGGHAELARLLLEHGAVATAQDKMMERTPLHEASDRGHVEVVRVLLEPIEVTQPLERCAVQKAGNGKRRTPLHGASAGGHAEVARLLLGHGADANAQDRKGRTPLHEAATFGHVEVARLLIEHGADATVQDNKGWTPLRWASTKRHVELAQLLGNSVDATAQE